MIVLIAGVMKFGVSTQVIKRLGSVFWPCPYQLSSNVLLLGGSPPRLVETMGLISNTETSDYRYHQ